LNGNGVFSRGEPFAFSDAGGRYRMDNVLPGRYRVAVVELGPRFEHPEHTQLVVPGGSHDADFGIAYDAGTGMIHGVVFDDRDGDRIQDADESGVAGAPVRFDSSGNGSLGPEDRVIRADSGGYFKIAGLKRGSYLVMTEAPDLDWYSTSSRGGTFTMKPHERRLVSSGWQRRGTASVSGRAFFDSNGDGSNYLDDPANGWHVYADFDRDGIHDAGEPDAYTTGGGTYRLYDVFAGPQLIRFVPPQDDWTITHGDASMDVELSPGQLLRLNVGGRRPGKIAGGVFRDINLNGKWDAGETGLAGFRVYLDESGNGRYERHERSAITDENGYYELTGLAPRSYSVGLSGLGTWVASTPAYETQRVGPDRTTNLHFGLKPGSGFFGAVFHDLDGNGVPIGNEPGLAGVTVYLDLDGDGVFDENEPATKTDGVGFWLLDKEMPSGMYTFRVVGHIAERKVMLNGPRLRFVPSIAARPVPPPPHVPAPWPDH
jgi:hypothetical protein